MATYHGKTGVAYISTNGTGAGVTVAHLTSWSLDMATDKQETTGFGDANKTYVQGLKDLKGAIAGFWDDANETLFKAADSSNGCGIYLYPSSDAGSKRYWFGPAWLDCSVECGVDAPVRLTANFVANGSWTRTWG